MELIEEVESFQLYIVSLILWMTLLFRMKDKEELKIYIKLTKDIIEYMDNIPEIRDFVKKVSQCNTYKI